MLTLIAQFGDQGIVPSEGRFLPSTTDTTGAQALTQLELFISNILGFLTVTAAIFFIVYFVMGAYKWTAAGGDSGKVSKARDQMIQGVLGLILIVASYGIIGVIGTVVGINILNPAEQIQRIMGP